MTITERSHTSRKGVHPISKTSRRKVLMFNRIALGTLVVLCALAFVTPAGAATVNGVDYVLLGKSEILMEGSDLCTNPPTPNTGLKCMYIQGNVGVSDTNGRLRVGSKNIISNLAGNATATAHNIVMASFSDIDICRYNVTSGAVPASVCGSIVTPLPAGTLPLFAGWLPGSGPLGPVSADPCVNTAASFIVPAGGTLDLPSPAGIFCYKDIRVNAGGTLNLGPGNYKFKSLTLLPGAIVAGAGLATTTLTIQNPMLTNNGVKISNIRIQSPGTPGFSVTEFISIGNDSILTNVILYVPSAAIHLHLGTTGKNVEAIANYITVEPVVLETEDVGTDCGCFETVTPTTFTTILQISDADNLAKVEKFFLLVGTCDVPAVCAAPNCFQTPFTLNALQTQATLDTTLVGAGTYKVVGQWTAGTFCNNTLVTK
jgi:hypothetical protein